MSESGATSVDAAIAPATCLPPPVPQKPTNTNPAMSSSTARANSTPSPSAQLKDPSKTPSSQRARRHGSQKPSSSQMVSLQANAANKTQASKKSPNFRKPQSFVTIHADKGPKKSTFVIHKSLICHHSPFFLNAFSGDFIEAKTQTMEMEDIKSPIFGLFVHWLYTQTIEFEEDEDRQNQTSLLADLWLLAESCQISKLQNEIMAMLHPKVGFEDLVELRALSARVYKICGGKSKLRKMVVEKVAFGSTDKEIMCWMQAGGLPDGMAIDVMMALKKGNKGVGDDACAVEKYFV